MVKQHVFEALERIDALIARATVRVVPDRDALLIFLFHAILPDPDSARDTLLPGQAMSVAQFRSFVEYFLKHGYSFIGTEHIERGLGGGKQVLLTFDDGYYNNVHALPVLREFNVPALFFPSTSFVKRGTGYWWNVLHRELRARGASQEEVAAQCRLRKKETPAAIEQFLLGQFGEKSLVPRGDDDRPFTASELGDFSRDPHVRIGNHTADHAILTNEDPAGIRHQISQAQADLEAITGAAPSVISYPNGNESATIRQIAHECGLSIGIGVEPGKNRLPLTLESPTIMHLHRFGVDEPSLLSLPLFRWDRQWSLTRAGRSAARLLRL